MSYEIRGNYPYYTIWENGVEDTRFACNTLEQAQALILELRAEEALHARRLIFTQGMK